MFSAAVTSFGPKSNQRQSAEKIPNRSFAKVSRRFDRTRAQNDRNTQELPTDQASAGKKFATGRLGRYSVPSLYTVYGSLYLSLIRVSEHTSSLKKPKIVCLLGYPG